MPKQEKKSLGESLVEAGVITAEQLKQAKIQEKQTGHRLQKVLVDTGLINEEPNWFNYQTISVKKVDYGGFQVFEITLGDMEQDFSVPGPYGH